MVLLHAKCNNARENTKVNMAVFQETRIYRKHNDSAPIGRRMTDYTTQISSAFLS